MLLPMTRRKAPAWRKWNGSIAHFTHCALVNLMSQSYTDKTVKDDIAQVELDMLCVVFVAGALCVHDS